MFGMWQIREGASSTQADNAGSRKQSSRLDRECSVGRRKKRADQVGKGITVALGENVEFNLWYTYKKGWPHCWEYKMNERPCPRDFRN